ncbi:MAG: GMC family oxidoreductase N-terminal domain-containing protein [Saprospiraceae bacterium]|nr:GMC family oxidoreductase N-terminal domain-containing protein [Saprospiraceae bacterium]
MTNPRHLSALAALCDTLIPSIQKTDDPEGYWSRKASDLNVPARILELVARTKPEDQVQFSQLLDLISGPLLGLTWFGPLKSADRLTPAQRETLLRRWANSPLPPVRNAFNVLRKLTALLYFGDIPSGASENPNWKTIGYRQLKEHIKPDSAPLPMLMPEPGTTLDCDVLVIGSGAGGSIVAAELAAAGHDVLIVEKSGYSPTHTFTQEEVPMLQRHFEAGGLLTSQSGAVTVLAGSTLGGGTTINWAASLRTPDYVLEEWASEHGNPHFLEKEYLRGFDAVEKRNGIRADFQHDPQNQTLLDAAQKLGYRAEAIPMNLRFPTDLPADVAWKAAGYSCYGDAYGIKQGAAQTFLRDAVAKGARILPDTDIQRIIVKNGEAVGATCRPHPRPLPQREGSAAHGTLYGSPPVGAGVLHINARRIVVAAGALHTPVLLLKSGLTHPHIGRNLYLHPVAAVGAFHEREMLPWQGPMMSAIVQEFARLDGNWGVRIECPPVHPGLAAFALSWDGAEAFKRDLADIRRLAVDICLTRDRFGGRVAVGKQSGQPVIHYKLNQYDKNHLLRGIQESVRLHVAGGAKRVSVMHNRPLHFFPEKGGLDKFLAEVARRPWGANWFGLFSAHQMGTCRMGGDRHYPVKPNGETREVRNLYVADGSLFPSASGTNPMLSIQALAWWVAQNMKH